MFDTSQRIFFIGIGGIGTSALARLLHSQGLEISGSDLSRSEVTDKLEKDGIGVVIGHQPSNLPKDTDLLIYSAAVPEDNPERSQAKILKIPALSFPKALGEYAKGKKVIAVAGTNGKTTTTAMIARILVEAGFDPTAIVGSEVLAWQSNARLGKGEYFVLEADEYRRAFLNYSSEIAIITNIAADHLDYFKDLEDVKNAFVEFAEKVKPGGVLVYNEDDPNTESLVCRFIGSSQLGRKIGFQTEGFELQVPGKFNLANASAAAAVCRQLKVPETIIRSALKNFTGTWRRFQKIGRVGKTEIYSDYAHHPEGIKATLEMIAEEFSGKKVLIVFEPHQRNRTKMLFQNFVKSFCESGLQDFILTEIFEVAGREEVKDQNISSQNLVEEIEKCGKRVSYVKDLGDCEARIRELYQDYDMIIFMGAGDIYKVANNLVKAQPLLTQRLRESDHGDLGKI